MLKARPLLPPEVTSRRLPQNSRSRRDRITTLTSFTRTLIACALLALLPSSLSAQRARRGRTSQPATRKPAAQKPPNSQPSTTPRTQPAPQTAGVNLSAEDVRLILDGLGVPPQARAQLAASAEDRKRFAQDLKEMFAIAEEARKAGFAERPELKLQMALSRAFIIARAYNRKRQAEGATAPEQVVSKEEAAAFAKEPGQEQKFQEFLQDYARTQNLPLTAVNDQRREELRQNWANVMVASRKGVAAGLDKERANQLAVMYQHARLLAGAYFREQLEPRTAATEAEIDAYFAAHPELDPQKARAKAEEILKRVRAGEDFAALARQFSDDTSNKNTGGDLGWFGRGVMVKPFEDAAFGLQPGEISNVVETQFGFHVIKLDDRRTQTGANGQPVEQVHARHILIMPSGGQRNSQGGPQNPRQQAREAVQKEKREKLLAEISSRSRVTVAEDFSVSP